MAEWLRRLTRIEFLIVIGYSDQMGFSRVGSNPTHCEFFSVELIKEENFEIMT